jgi:predicted RNA-binding protein with TRAM domain
MQNEKQSLVGEEYEVEVGPVAHGGHCIARTADGRVLFVRHALPAARAAHRRLADTLNSAV